MASNGYADSRLKQEHSNLSLVFLNVGVNQTTYAIAEQNIYFAGFDDRCYLAFTKRGMRHSLSAAIGVPSIVG